MIINLIAATTTNTDLKLYARLNNQTYKRDINVTDNQLTEININRHTFHSNKNTT